MATDFNVRISASIDLTQARAQMEQFRQQYQSLVINGSASGAGGTRGSSSRTAVVGGLNGTADGIQRVGNSARSSTTMLGSFTRELGNLKNTIPKVAAFSVATAAISAFTTGIKDAVGAVVEMDKQLTEFKKVSTLSGQGLDDFAKKASQMGKDVGRIGSEMVEAATSFRKSGFGDYDSLELAHVSAMFQNIADSEMDAGEAASFITSQLKAFGITASNATHVIDAVNEV